MTVENLEVTSGDDTKLEYDIEIDSSVADAEKLHDAAEEIENEVSSVARGVSREVISETEIGDDFRTKKTEVEKKIFLRLQEMVDESGIEIGRVEIKNFIQDQEVFDEVEDRGYVTGESKYRTEWN